MKRFLSTIAFLFLSPVVVYALGLGDVVVNSALNQPLDGKIELLSPSPDDLDSLKIGLADSNAFAKAGIDRPFSLSKLKFNLRRSIDDGDDYLVSVNKLSDIKYMVRFFSLKKLGESLIRVI